MNIENMENESAHSNEYDLVFEEDSQEYVELPSEETQIINEENYYENTVSGSDIITNNTIQEPNNIILECKYEPKPKIWESDIMTYDTTDGLLLMILIVLLLSLVIRRN